MVGIGMVIEEFTRYFARIFTNMSDIKHLIISYSGLIITFIIFSMILFDVLFGEYDSLVIHSTLATIGIIGFVNTLIIFLSWTMNIFEQYREINQNNNTTQNNIIIRTTQNNEEINRYWLDARPNEDLEESVVEENCENKCFFCCERRIRTVIIPCGHMISCVTCSLKIPKNECPICKRKIHIISRTYSCNAEDIEEEEEEEEEEDVKVVEEEEGKK